MIHIPTLKLRLALEGILVGLFAGGCALCAAALNTFRNGAPSWWLFCRTSP